MSQDYLTKGDVAPLPFDAMDLLAAYADLTNARSTGVEDELLFAATQFLTAEPFADENLHPANWLVDKPRLSLFALVTPKNTFALEVGPRRDAMPNLQVRGKTAIGLEDFTQFAIPEYSRKYPRTRVLELPLDAVGFYLDQPAPTADQAAAFRLQRRIINAMYEFAVRRLAKLFQCQLLDILVCYGPENFLAIRHVTQLENQVEQLDVATSDAQETWHPDFAALCLKAGTNVKDITAFWTRDLAKLPASQRSTVLADFLGGGASMTGVVQELVGVLGVVANPETYPPLTNNNKENVQWTLDRLLPRGSHSLAKLTSAYHMSEDSALALVRELDLDRYDSLEHAPGTLVKEINDMFDQEATPSRRYTRYQDKLIEGLSRMLERRSGFLRRAVQVADIARDCGFVHPRQLTDFLEKKAPAVAAWLGENEVAYRSGLRTSQNRQQV